MEIEGERVLRARAEKTTESVAKKFEEALRGQVAATEQLNAAEERFLSLRVRADQNDRELQAMVQRLEGQIQALEAALTETQLALSRANGQDVLVEQIVAKLVATSDAQAKAPKQQVEVGQGGRKKRPVT